VNLSGLSSIEFCLWDAHDDTTYFQRKLHSGQVEVEDGVIYHKTECRAPAPLCVVCLQGPRRRLQHPAGSLPRAVRRLGCPGVVEGESHNSIAHGWSPMGCHHSRLSLRPGETQETVFPFG